jgi:hypothetical protein
VTLIPLDGSTTVFSEYIGGGEAVLIAAAYTFYLVFFIIDEFINEPGKVSSPTVGPYAGEPGNLVLLSKKMVSLVAQNRWTLGPSGTLKGPGVAL